MQEPCRKGESDSILTSSLAWDIARCFVKRTRVRTQKCPPHNNADEDHECEQSRFGACGVLQPGCRSDASLEPWKLSRHYDLLFHKLGDENANLLVERNFSTN